MIKNYFKIAFRNLWRQKVFSLINLVGLAVGMSACFLIFLYVNFELSYDKYHEKAGQIYRLVTDVKTPTETINADITSGPMGLKLKTDFPEVHDAVRIDMSSLLLQRGDKKFQEDDIFYADPSLFSVFSFPLVKGNPKTALTAPFNIVLSETTAKKYFGNEDPMGKNLVMPDGNYNLLITGVMKDIPANSHFKGDIVVSMSTLTQKFSPGRDEQWGNFGFYTYLLLPKGYDPNKLQAKFAGFMNKYITGEMKSEGMDYALFLEPLTSVYLGSTRGAPEQGSLSNVYIFSVIAIFILLIACINFINLTTARSAERAKEVGIRKVVGAERKQLTTQFLGESTLLCLIAFLFAVLFCSLLLPLFNQLAGKTISESIFNQGSNILLLFVIALGIGLIAGIYPALVLSGFKPISVLKGRFVSGKKGTVLRKGLVIAQFTISIILITGTLVVYTQLDYMRNQELGFKKDQVLVMNFQGDKGIGALQNELKKIPGVVSTTLSSSIPGRGNSVAYSQLQNKSGDMQAANLDLYFVDFDFINNYQFKVVAGRPFSRDFMTDTTKAMVINEATAKSFGYTKPQEAVGRKFSQWGREGQIIGVVKDFHFRTLKQPIKPLTMRIGEGNLSYISINVEAKNLPATLAAIEQKWKQHIPTYPFSYFFADEDFETQYRAENRFGTLFLYFAVLAIFISCLGLLGLTAYSTIQRTKEISVRKVLGASVSGIVNLLSRDFLKLVLIAFAIASPIAWFGMNKWLQDFAYRINMSWWVLAVAGLSAILIAFITISFHAIKSAVANPVNNLRTE